MLQYLFSFKMENGDNLQLKLEKEQAIDTSVWMVPANATISLCAYMCNQFRI